MTTNIVAIGEKVKSGEIILVLLLKSCIGNRGTLRWNLV